MSGVATEAARKNRFRTRMPRFVLGDRIVRDHPGSRRLHMTELPLASSGGWPPGDADHVRALLAEADARASAAPPDPTR